MNIKNIEIFFLPDSYGKYLLTKTGTCFVLSNENKLLKIIDMSSSGFYNFAKHLTVNRYVCYKLKERDASLEIIDCDESLFLIERKNNAIVVKEYYRENLDYQVLKEDILSMFYNIAGKLYPVPTDVCCYEIKDRILKKVCAVLPIPFLTEQKGAIR